MPQVSVIIPNYNYEKYLEQRLISIINQTYRDFEIIFLDDSSNDKSVLLAKSILANTNIPFEIHINEKNSGSPFKQWNKGLQIAKSEYIWIAEADDFCEYHFLEQLLALIKKSDNVGLAYCQTSPVDCDGKLISSINYIQYTDFLDKDKWLSEYTNNGCLEVENYLCRLCTIINISSVIFRNETMLKAGYVDTRYKQAGDWLTYIKLLEHSDIAYTPEILNYHRLHPSKNTNNTVTNLIYFKDMLNIFKYTHNHFDISAKTRKMQFKHIIGQWNDHYNGTYGKISNMNNLILLVRLLAFYPMHSLTIAAQYLKILLKNLNRRIGF